MALVSKIKEETGIDLVSFRWGRGDQLGKALEGLTRLTCKYDGLSQIRERIGRMAATMDEIGDLINPVAEGDGQV